MCARVRGAEAGRRRCLAGFIPEGVRWYLADLVVEHQIDADARNVVHVNTHLVEAGSPDEAYAKALALGRAEDHEYELVVHTMDGRQTIGEVNLGCPK